MKLNHNQFNLFVACLGFEQLYLDGFVYVIWKYEDCYLLQLMLLNHNKFNMIVACLGFEQLIICLSFMTWIQIYFSVLGFEYSLKYGFVLLARILTRIGIPILYINYLYQKRKEVFVVNFIESYIFLVVLRRGVVVPTVTFCNYCQNWSLKRWYWEAEHSKCVTRISAN